VEPSVEYPKVLSGLTNVAQFDPTKFKGWDQGWASLTEGQKAEAARNLSAVWQNNLEGWADYVPPKLKWPDQKSAEAVRSEATPVGNALAKVEPILVEANKQIAALDLDSRLRKYRNPGDAQNAVDEALRPMLSRASQAVVDEQKEVNNATINADRKAKKDRLEAQDTKLTGEATQAYKIPPGVRVAREDLKRKLDEAKASADARELKFAFPKAQALYEKLEDDEWEETANARVNWKSTNSLAQVRKDLEEKLRQKKAGFELSKELVQKLGTAETNLVTELTVKAREEAGKVLALAIQADENRATAASATARTNVFAAHGKLVEQLEQLKSDSGAVTTNSVRIREELVAVSNWLKSPALQVDDSTWTPTNQPPTAKAEWDTRYDEVPRARARFQEAKKEWERAEKLIGEVDQFNNPAAFEDLNKLLGTDLLKNKSRFKQAWEELQKYLKLVTTGELLRTSTDTNRFKAYITEITEPTPQKPEYFKTLVPDLEKQLKKLNDEAEAAAKQAAMKAAAEAEKRMKAEQLKTLRETFVAAAKGVGGLTFEGTNYRRVRNPDIDQVQKWKDALAADREKYLSLRAELDPSSNRAKVEKELDDLGKEIQKAIDYVGN